MRHSRLSKRISRFLGDLSMRTREVSLGARVRHLAVMVEVRHRLLAVAPGAFGREPQDKGKSWMGLLMEVQW